MARQAFDMSLAVPQVVAQRVLQIAAAGTNPSAKDRKEFALMSNEKVQAFYQSWGAMWMQLFKTQMSMATMWMTPFPSKGPAGLSRMAANATAQVMAAGLAPVHAKAVANSKRLARIRR